MNQKDYKAIAKIMEYHIKENDNDLKHPSMTKEKHDDVARFIETICHQLADYFEKSKDKLNLKTQRRILNFIGEELRPFDKEQFLKDCGVE